MFSDELPTPPISFIVRVRSCSRIGESQKAMSKLMHENIAISGRFLTHGQLCAFMHTEHATYKFSLWCIYAYLHRGGFWVFFVLFTHHYTTHHTYAQKAFFFFSRHGVGNKCWCRHCADSLTYPSLSLHLSHLVSRGTSVSHSSIVCWSEVVYWLFTTTRFLRSHSRFLLHTQLDALLANKKLFASILMSAKFSKSETRQ